MMNKEELEQTADLHSDEVQQIMSQMPSWTERWGIVMAGLALLCLILSASLISWPDTEEVQATLRVERRGKSIAGSLWISASDYSRISNLKKAEIVVGGLSKRGNVFLQADNLQFVDSTDRSGIYALSFHLPKLSKHEVNMAVPFNRVLAGKIRIEQRRQTLLGRMVKRLHRVAK